MSTHSPVTSPLQARGCVFHQLLTREMSALDELKEYLRESCEGAEEELLLCSPASEPPTFTRVALRKGQEVCFTGYVCPGHESIIDEALADSQSDLERIEGITDTCYYPLTTKELNGEFDEFVRSAVTVHTSHAQLCQSWQEVTLPGDAINALGGRVIQREDVAATVSYYVYGHTDPGEGPLRSHVYFPLLEVQALIPTDNINGVGDECWLPKTLLRQLRAKPSYRDGVTATGLSMFELRPRSLKEEIRDFIGSADQSHQADEKFVPTPAKDSRFIKSDYTGASIWAAHEGQIQGADTRAVTMSPGKLQYVPSITTAALVGNNSDRLASTCTCGRPIVGDGTNMCACGKIARSDLMAKQGLSGVKLPSTTFSVPATWAHNAIAARFKQSIKAATAALAPGVAAAPHISTSASFQAASTTTTTTPPKGGGGDGGGDGGDGGDGGGDDGDDGSGSQGGSRNRRPQSTSPWLAAGAIQHGILSTLDDPRYLAVEQRVAELNSLIVATALSEMYQMQQALQVSQQAHAERLAREAAAAALLVDVNKKENDKFPVGNAQLTLLLRSHGCHGDQTGTRYPVMEQIACNVENAKFYTALVSATADPRTKAAFTFPMPAHLLYNICATRFGGAASLLGVLPEFGGAASITDFIRVEPSRPTFGGVIHLSTEVPVKGKIVFVTDDERQRQAFKSIHELVDAWNGCARIVSMAFGPAWYDVFVACGQRLQELYFSNPQLYHLALLRWLSDAGLLDWIQTLRQMASNKDYLLSQYRCNLALSKGFLTPTIIPGDGFEPGPWMTANLDEPFNADIQALVRASMPISVADRLRGHYSSIPHASLPFVLPVSTTSTVGTRTGHTGPRNTRSTRVGEVECHLCDSDDENVAEAEELGATSGKGARASLAASDTGRGTGRVVLKPLVSISGHDVKKGYGGIPNTVDAHGRPAGPACLRFNCFSPLDQHGIPLRDVPHACPANNPGHPMFKPGFVCSKSHGTLCGLMPWATQAVALSLGGCRLGVPGVPTRPPQDPVKLQRLSEKMLKHAAANVPLDQGNGLGGPLTESLGYDTEDRVLLDGDTWDRLTLGDAERLALGTETEDHAYILQGEGMFAGYGDSYFYGDSHVVRLGQAADRMTNASEEARVGENSEDSITLGEPDATIRWRTSAKLTADRPLEPGECTRTGQVSVKHFPWSMEVMDVGSRMRWLDEQGVTHSRGKSCLLNTLGALCAKYGYPSAAYRQQALTEFERTDVRGRPEYAEFAAALRGQGTLVLGMLVHMALPERVALVVIQQRLGLAAKLLLFKYGSVDAVEFAIIDKGHIMPMVCSHSPCNAASWADFEPVMVKFRQQGGLVVTKHTSRSLRVRGGIQPGLGSLDNETLGDYADDTMDTDLLLELGMEATQEVVGEDTALLKRVARELEGIVADLDELKVLTEASKQKASKRAVVEYIRSNGNLWEHYPILRDYYNLRARLWGYAEQHCDINTQSFLHWLWQMAGTVELPHPMPHLLRSVVSSLVTGEAGLFPISLFVALATTKLGVEDAAALVVLNLTEGEPGRYPTSQGRQILAERLGQVYDILVQKMGGDAPAHEVIKGHLFVRSSQEWRDRVAHGGHESQSAWLSRSLDTYSGYLHERKCRQGFFNNGAYDETHEAKQQRADRSKRLRVRLTSEAANTKEVANHDSLQGCWNLDSPFTKLCVGVQISSTPGKQKAAAKKPPTPEGSPRAKSALKRVRVDQASDEQTDAGSGSTRSTKDGWRGYEPGVYVERVYGPTSMRSVEEIQEDLARKYPLTPLEQRRRHERDARSGSRGASCPINLVSPSPAAIESPEVEVLLPQRTTSLIEIESAAVMSRPSELDEIESAEVIEPAVVMPRPSEHAVSLDTVASQEAMTRPSTLEESGEVDTVLLEPGAELPKQAVIDTPIAETEPGVRVLTATESHRGDIFRNDGAYRYKFAAKRDDIVLGGDEGAGTCDKQCEFDCHCPRPGVHFPQGLSIPIPAHENLFDILKTTIPIDAVEQGAVEAVEIKDTASRPVVGNPSYISRRERRSTQVKEWQDLQRQRKLSQADEWHDLHRQRKPHHDATVIVDQRGRERQRIGTSVSASVVKDASDGVPEVGRVNILKSERVKGVSESFLSTDGHRIELHGNEGSSRTPLSSWAWRRSKKSKLVSTWRATNSNKRVAVGGAVRWAARRLQLSRRSRCRPARTKQVASQRWSSEDDDPDDDTWVHIQLSGGVDDEQRDALAAAQDMLRHDSPQICELQPLVHKLKDAAKELKVAILSKEPAGESKRKQLQDAYLLASNNLCHASVAVCNNSWWPQLFLAAYRASHPGRVNPLVDPTALRQAFEGLIDDTVLRTVVAQATVGQEVYLSRPTQSSWPRETPTAKLYKDEIWRTVWTDAAYESTFVFGPECKKAMDLANMQGYPLHRIPKHDTATGQPTGKGRLIADLSFANESGHSINSTTLIDLYDKFRMPSHADVARDILLLRHWFPKLAILISKLDVARAFRQKMLSIGSFGVFACLLSGYFLVDQAFVFGHSAAPSAYASSGQAIHEAHNASGVHFSGQELRDAGYIGYENLTAQEKIEGIWIKFFSRTYCDDGILVALQWKTYQDASMDSYKKFMVAALGPEAISEKNPEEQEWREQQTVIGHVFSLGGEPDERGDKDFLSPTPERIKRMLLVMSDSQFTPQGKDMLTAGLCAKAFSLWLWMCIPCPRCKAFIGSFKRVFEGKKQWSAGDIVSPVRRGDNPEMAWQMFWDDMLTLKTILGNHLLAPGFFRVPLFRLLGEEEQLMCYAERFDTIATDACQIGGGGFCYTGRYAGHYFRVAFPEWVVKDIKACMEKGHSEGDSSKYTIAVVEKAMHTLGMLLYGETGKCYVMLQDNQNVVDWVRKGWSKPVRVQNYMRRDVMIARHRNMWAAIQYIHTTLNKLADWLSRSFTETGADNLEVLAEFHAEVKRMGLTATETPVPTELLAQLLAKQVEPCDLNRLESYVSESWTLQESAVAASTSLDRQALHSSTDSKGSQRIDEVVGSERRLDRQALHSSTDNEVSQRSDEVVGSKSESSLWKSPLDEPDDDDEWRSLALGALGARSGDSYEVDKILRVRTHARVGIQYRVHFVGFDNRANRWVRPEECEMQALITTFEALVASRGDLPAECATDAKAEKFYYGIRPDEVQIVGGTQLRPPTLAHKEQVSNGPGQGAWQRGGRGNTTNVRNTEAAQMHLRPANEGEWRSDVDEDTRGSAIRQQNTTMSRSVFRDGLGSSALNSRQVTGNKGTTKGGKGCTRSKGRNEYVESQGHNRGFMGPSLTDQATAAAAAAAVGRGGRQRMEVYIAPHDDRLRRAAAETLMNSMATNTRKTYGNNLKFFLGFCERQHLSPILDGSDKRGEEARLIEYVMYEYEVHRNKYSTIKVKLYAIRAATMDEGYANPLENKPTLARHMKGIKALRGATDSKEPLPPEAFRNILLQTQGTPLLLRAAALAIAIGFFFLLRISEFAARDKWYMESFILLRQDVTFFQNNQRCAWDHPLVDAVELHIRGSKTDQRKQGCRRMQQASGDLILCPVRCMVEWFRLTEGSYVPATAPLFSVPYGRNGSDWRVMTRETVTLLMKGAAVDCGLKPKHVATHSIRISGATALLIAGVAADVVKIMGRWLSDAFIGYTRYQAELMAGIAQRMVNTSYVVRPY